MKSNLRCRVLFFFLMLMGCFGSVKSYADHLSSIEMYVDYIGTGPTNMKYKVTMILYRICVGNNLQLGTTTYSNLTISSATGGFTPITRNPTSVLLPSGRYEDTLDFLCPAFSSINSCRVLANTTYSGYTMRKYEDTVTVPTRSSDLKFTWQSCCRLATYANINGLSGPQFYIEAGINNLIRYNASTPRYNGLPFTFCCTNQPSVFSSLPFSPDGDSLSTSNYAPQQTNTTTVVYNAGYSSTQPAGTTAPSYYNVSPVSGKANFLATNQGKYVFGFRTTAYERGTGKQISYASRDATITVLPCTNTPPYIDTIPQSLTGVKRIDTTGGDVVLSACPQIPLNFIINAHSNNANGLIYMRPGSALPTGMTMTPTVTGGTGYMTVSWTPTASQVGPYTLSIVAVDSTCAVGQEITLRNEFTFTVNVLPGLNAGPDLLVCPLGERPVKLGTNANPASTVTWTNLSGAVAEYLTCTSCPNPLATPPRSYAYVATTNDPTYVCKSSDTVVVFIDTTVTIKALQEPLIVCRPAYVQLQSQAYGPAPYANLPCGVLGNVKCSQEDSVTVGVGNNGPSSAVNSPFYSGAAYHKYQFIIPKAELLGSGLYSGTLNSLSFQTLGAILGTAPLQGFNVSLACVRYDKFITPATNATFDNSATLVANYSSYALTPNAWNKIVFSQPYNWDTSTNLLVDICMGPMATPNISGNDVVAMVPGMTIQKYDNLLNVCGGNAATVQVYYDRPVVKLNYCAPPTLPFDYHWAVGNNLKDSNVQNPIAYIARDINYAVFTVGRNGCLVKDSLHITVPDHKLFVGPVDTVACLNQIVPLHATGGSAYQWFEVHGGAFSSASGSLTCTNCADPVATPPVTTTYAVVFSNNIGDGNPINPTYSTGCPDTLSITVYVNPLPEVVIDTRDTMISFGKSVQLFAHGAQTYSWGPARQLSDANSPAPLATPNETTTYVVYGKDINGCIASDSVLISIDYSGSVTVPTAFSPNGDGRNDLFRVSNMGTRKLLEFRVFNRWGQEVFSTTDANKGWDGQWNGEDQEVGTYQYIIRIGYPDKTTGLFRGDVTLVR